MNLMSLTSRPRAAASRIGSGFAKPKSSRSDSIPRHRAAAELGLGHQIGLAHLDRLVLNAARHARGLTAVDHPPVETKADGAHPSVVERSPVVPAFSRCRTRGRRCWENRVISSMSGKPKKRN